MHYRPTFNPDLERKLAHARLRCSQHLADGNAAKEAGNTVKANRHYEASQRWLDKVNKLEGRS